MNTRESSPAFKAGRIGSLGLKNRLVRSATYENAATYEGKVTDYLVDFYRTLAKGGVGLIITGIIPACSRVHAPRQMRLDDDSCIPGLRRITAAVHELKNDCRIMAQLHHPGRQVLDRERMAEVARYLPHALLAAMKARQVEPGRAEPHSEIEPTAPSAIFDATFRRTPRALSLDEIEEIINAYAEGIRRAREAGFDGVQLHAAHGWLLSSFLSPCTNQRGDLYGGSTENRTRIVTEIYKRARMKVDEDFPILVKFNTNDFLPGGIDTEEALKIATILAKTGFAALETSGGMWEAVTRPREELGWTPVLLPESRTAIRSKDQEAYFLPAATVIKKQVDVPIMLVGGMKSIDRIEEILEAGYVDFVSMARPLLRQPDLPNLWLSDKGSETAACLSCNACLPIGPEPSRCRAEKIRR